MGSRLAVLALVAVALTAGLLTVGGSRHAQAAGATCSSVMASRLPAGTLAPDGTVLSGSNTEWEQVSAQCTPAAATVQVVVPDCAPTCGAHRQIVEWWAHAPGDCTLSQTTEPNDTITCPGKADGRICMYLRKDPGPDVPVAISSETLHVTFGGASPFDATPALDAAAKGCGPGDPPVNTTVPAITGDAIPGGTLTCDKGTWSGDMPQQYTYQWFKNGSLVSTDPTYTPTTADAGADFVCEVTATNPEGDATNAFSGSVTVTAPATGGAGGSGGTGGAGGTPSDFVLAFNARGFVAEGLVKPPGTRPFVHAEYLSLLHVTGADYPGGTATATLPPNADSVTFNGIPILAPVTAGNVRTIRITNVRANTTAQFDVGMNVPLPLLGPGQVFKIPESLAIGAGADPTPLASVGLTGALVYPKGIFGRHEPARAPVWAGGRLIGLGGTFSSNLPAGIDNPLAPGTADPNAVIRLDVAIAGGRPDGRVRAAAAKCTYYAGRGRLRRVPPRHGGCFDLLWLEARIRPFSREWFYGFDPGHPLPAGTWTAYIRPITRAGIGDPSVRDQYKASPYRYVFVCRPRTC